MSKARSAIWGTFFDTDFVFGGRRVWLAVCVSFKDVKCTPSHLTFAIPRASKDGPNVRPVELVVLDDPKIRPSWNFPKPQITPPAWLTTSQARLREEPLEKMSDGWNSWCFIMHCVIATMKSVYTYIHICSGAPHGNGGHQVCCIFSRGSPETLTCHCYWEGEHPNTCHKTT